MSWQGSHPNARRRGTLWTPQDDYRLWKLLESGASHREIAVALGRTTETIHARATELHRLRREGVA